MNKKGNIIIAKIYLFLLFITIIIFLAAPHGMWNLSSLTRDQAYISSIGSPES